MRNLCIQVPNAVALRRVLFGAIPGIALLALTGCAALLPSRDASVTVATGERLYFTVAPLDSAARAELARAGLDPARVEEELRAELRYQLFLRGQEEALDSVGAAVAARLAVHHLQPGFGRTGSYAEFTLTGSRADEPAQVVRWTWEGVARDNAPPEFAARHLARQAAAEALARMRPPKKDYEPPPPLHLMK